MELFIISIILGSFLYFGYSLWQRVKKSNVLMSAKANPFSKEIKELTEAKSSKSKTDLFLASAQFFEQMARLQDKMVYKYIYNAGILYEFKDFLPRDKIVNIISDEALSFDYLYYTRVNAPNDFILKYGDHLKI